MGFLRLRRPWGFSHEARRGPQGASRAAPGTSCLHAHGEGELVITLESWEVPNVPLQGPQGSQVCIPDSPRESGLMSKGSKGLCSPFELRSEELMLLNCGVGEDS